MVTLKYISFIMVEQGFIIYDKKLWIINNLNLNLNIKVKSQIPLVMNLMLKIMFIYRVCVYQEPKSIKNSI